MSRLRYNYLGILLLWLPGTIAFAQTPRVSETVSPSTYMIRQFTTNDGLPTNFLQQVFQSKSGYVWVASEHGLTRYDGSEIRTKNSANTEGWVGIDRVQTICEDKNGAIWFNGGGEHADHVYALRRQGLDQAVVQVAVEPLSRLVCLPNERVAYLSDGNLTIASDLRTQRTIPLPPSLRNEIGVAVNVIDDDELWFYLGKKVVQYRDGAFQFDSELPESFLSVVKDEYGRVIGVSEKKLYEFEENKFTLRHSFENPGPNLFSTDPSKIWLNAGEGVYQVDSENVIQHSYQQGGDQHLYVLNVHNLDGKVYATWNVSRLEGRLLELQPNGQWKSLGLERYGVKVVNFVANDYEDGLWLTTDVGLFHLVPRKMEVYTTLEGLADPQVFALDMDANGHVWASLWGDGVQRLDGNKWINFNEETGLLSNYALSFLPDEDGSMWIGTHEGLMHFEDDKLLKAYPHQWHYPDTYTYTRDLLRDRDGRFWVANNYNLFEFVDGQFFAVWPDTFRQVKTVFEDQAGVLWAGTNEGLYKKDASPEWTHVSEEFFDLGEVQDISEDERGVLWFSLKHGGLVRTSDNGFFRYRSQEGLPSEKIHYSLDDGLGNIWLGTDNGIIRVSLAELDDVYFGRKGRLDSLQVFTEEDGLPSAELISGSSSAFKAPDGRLWVSTLAGIAVIDPVNLRFNTQVPRMQIQGFAVQGEWQSVRSGQGFRTGRQNTVTFEYATLSFRSSRRNEYRHRLLGEDEVWTYSNETEVSYPNLNPGTYTFEVEGSNNDDVWSQETAQLRFTILPAFYQTLWFWALVAGLVTWFLYLLYKQIRYKNALRIALTRNRIADDLHDDIGSKIGAVAQTLGFMSDKDVLDEKDLAMLGEQVKVTRKLVDDLRDSVWIVDSGKDTLAQLVSRMEGFAGHIGSGYQFSFEKPADIPHREINMDWRRNVYLLFKEGLHNVVRHAKANMLEVKIIISGDRFVLEVKDDGCGMVDQHTSTGRGISTMSRRAEQVGGILQIFSEPGNGTTVQFNCQMP